MKIIITALLIFAVIVLGVNLMRKDLPYDFEVVSGDLHCWIICTTEWANRDFQIVIEASNSQKLKVVLPAKTKSTKITGLSNGKEYKLSVSRKDFIGRVRYRSAIYYVFPSADIKKYVVLVGASVGKTWDLNNLPSRISNANVCFGYRGLFNFDKTPLIKSLKISSVKPDAVIIKECAAYFPRDTESSMEKINDWTSSLRKFGIQPILATVVPVTKQNAIQNQNRMNSINAFNQSLRNYGKKHNIPVLDLQRILSNNKKNGYLDEKYAVEDGLHLNKNVYLEILDKKLVDFINIDLKLKTMR